MIAFPNAKINLGLYVLNKREDGFHNIQTVMYPVHDLCDVIELIPADSFQFKTYGQSIEGKQEDNLCIKALQVLGVQLDKFELHLFKNIPMGAGLGGGSSDAASVLKMANAAFGMNNLDFVLKKIASMLGSDCPFFIDNTPKLCEGRGEIMQDIAVDLSNYVIQIVHPGIHVSTAEAYKNVTLKEPQQALEQIIRGDVREWKSALENVFEESVFKLYPEIQQIKEKMYADGAIYASMSGSGSAVYGIFTEKPSNPWPKH
jgi:4-diphosphocytidyl-2-C-methyl-D-erythritol kinase